MRQDLVLKPCADQGLPGNNLPWQSQWGRTLCQSLLQTRFCLETTSGRANGARPCAKALCRPGSAWKQPPWQSQWGRTLCQSLNIKAICRHPLWEEWAMNAHTHQQALVASPPLSIPTTFSYVLAAPPPPETTQAMNTFPAKAVPCKAPTGTRACALQPRVHHVVFRHCKTWTSKSPRFSW